MSRHGRYAPTTLAEHLDPLIEELIRHYGLDRWRSELMDIWQRITNESLALPPDCYERPLSTINRNGVPLQISVSMGPHSGGLRLLTEAGPLQRPMAERVARSTSILSTLGHLLGLEASAAAFNRGLLELLPDQESDLADWRGGLWLALGATPRGIRLKVYCNLKWGDARSRWVRAGRALAAVGLDDTTLESWCELAHGWGATLEPSGLMFAPGTEGLHSVRIYWRVRTLEWPALERLLQRLDPEFDPSELHSIADALTPGVGPWPDRALVVSQDFTLGAASAAGVKVDICCGAFPLGDPLYAQRIQEIIQQLGLDGREYREVLKIVVGAGLTAPAGSEHHEFVGLGHQPGEGYRLNVYLRPGLTQTWDSSARR